MARTKPPVAVLQRGKRLANGLMGAWLLNEGSGPSVFSNGAMGLQYKGTLTAGPTWVGGADGSALSFASGSAQTVQFPAAAISAFAFADTTFTIFVRAKYTTNATSGVIIADGNDDTNVGSNGGWAVVFTAAAAINFNAKDAAGNNVISQATSNTFNDGSFHNIVCEFTTSTTVSANNALSTYVDGTFQVSQTGQGGFVYAAPAAPVIGLEFGSRSGTNGTTTSLPLNGNIASVMIWNRGLSADEIELLSFDPYNMFRRFNVIAPLPPTLLAQICL